jgi:hypothetical protein
LIRLTLYRILVLGSIVVGLGADLINSGALVL